MIDTTGLPDELITQLSETKPPKRYKYHAVLEILDAEKWTSIDEILITLYKRGDGIWKRQNLYSILHLLRQRELIRIRATAEEKLYQLKEPNHEPPQP